MANLEELKANAEKADREAAEAAERRNAAVDEYDEARVNLMEPELIEEAESLGINPRNFESSDHLREAIKIKQLEAEEQSND